MQSISYKMIKDFGFEYKSLLLKLIYLKPNARAMLIDQMTLVQDIDRDDLIKIFQDVKFESISQEDIFKGLETNPNGLNRAKFWLFLLDIKDNSEKAKLILTYLDIENNKDNAKVASSIYLPVLNSLETNSLSQSQNEIIKYINNINDPEKYSDMPISKIMLATSGKFWDQKLITRHNAWNIVNYLNYLGLKSPDINWAEKYFNEKDVSKKLNEKFSLNLSYEEFVLNNAIEKNIKNKNLPGALL